MNTKLNNWFIIPDYRDEDGIYCGFINYYSYMSLLNDFDNNDVYNAQENDDRKIFLGYYGLTFLVRRRRKSIMNHWPIGNLRY